MNWTVEDSYAHLTMPQLMVKRAQDYPKLTSMRYKEYGIWNELTWQDVEEQVRYTALGLQALGFQKGEKLAILADNIPAWPIMLLAVHSLGGVVVGVYSSSVKEEVNYMVNYIEASIVFCEDQEQVDKLLEQRENFPNVRHVIFEDTRGMREYFSDDWFTSWEQLGDLGKAENQKNPEAFNTLVANTDPDDLCTFATTSGTTGKPKAAMLTARNFMDIARQTQDVLQIKAGMDYLSYLPFAWMPEQFYAISMSLYSGSVINFPESADTAFTDLKEVGPHIMFGAPRIWETLQSQVWVRIDESYPINRWLYKKCLALAGRAADFKMQGKGLPLGLSIMNPIANFIMFRPLKDVLGFLRLQHAYTGGGALGPDTLRFFRALGIPLKQLYGQTETMITVYQREGNVRHDTVGKPLSEDIKVKISDDGEILVFSPGTCQGYYKREETYKENFTDDGYFRSGDAGYIKDDGSIVVIDRIGDVMHTNKQEMFSPQFIENKLKFSPYIKEAVVYGNNLDYLAAMVNVDQLTMGKWAEDNGISYTTYMDLSQNLQIGELILKEVNEVNKELQDFEQIHRFTLLYKLLDADDEELTRTGKVRRNFVEDRYGDVISALYDRDIERFQATSEFIYQDGTSTTIHAEVIVYDTDAGIQAKQQSKNQELVA